MRRELALYDLEQSVGAIGTDGLQHVIRQLLGALGVQEADDRQGYDCSEIVCFVG